MGARGPAPRPKLEVVREGNPGKRSKAKLDAQVVFPPGRPAEPDWREFWPGVGEHEVARRVASREWALVVGALDQQGRLATVDRLVCVDHCVAAARVLLCERDISENGIYIATERGSAKNPAVTAANQYRTQLRFTIVQLMLSPAARARLNTPERHDGDEDDAFD